MSAAGTPPPTGPPSGTPTTTAGLGVRIGARLLDVLLIAIPVSIVFAILGLGTGGIGLDGWLPNAILSLLWFGYFVYFEATQGSTLGKRILGLTVVTADGSLPSYEATAKRNVWMLFGLVPYLGPLASLIAVIAIVVTISSDAADRGWHDQFAGTGVMR